MSTNNHHNSRCGFEETLVSYLYNEIKGLEKAKFEVHLDGCKTCVEEVSALGFVRSSLSEWRKIEFDVLDSPAISVPGFESSSIAVGSESTDVRSWFDKIRGLFAITNGWATATSFAAILAAIIGVAFVVMNISNSPEVAEQKQSTSHSDPKQDETSQPGSETSGPANAQLAQDKEVQQSIEPTEETPQKSPAIRSANLKIGKDIAADRPAKNEVRNKPENRPNETATANKKGTVESNNILNEVPKLTNFAVEEDNSLRLADLFDEIGSR